MKNKYYIYLIILFTLSSNVLAECSSQSECRSAFETIENPSWEDLSNLEEPTIEDFNKLNVDQKKQYIINSDFSDKDLKIAKEFFSEVNNINVGKTDFERYSKKLGITIELVGNIEEINSDGLITAKNGKINIQDFKEIYNFIVNSDGNILIIDKGKNEHSFSGEIVKDSTGNIRIISGNLDGVPVKLGYGIKFNQNGKIEGKAKSINGVKFPSISNFKYDTQQNLMTINDAEIIAINKEIYIQGKIIIDKEKMHFLGKKLNVLRGTKLKITHNNGAELDIFAQKKDVNIEFDDSIDTSILESAKSNMFKFFEKKEIGKQNKIIITPNSLDIQGNSNAYKIKVYETYLQSIAGLKPINNKNSYANVDFSKSRNNKYFQKGDKGDSVKKIQTMLYDFGFLKGDKSKQIDGRFGPNTDRALRNWQNSIYSKKGVCTGIRTKSGCSADGKFGRASFKQYSNYGKLSSITLSPNTGRMFITTKPGEVDFQIDGKVEIDLQGKNSLSIGNTNYESINSKIFKSLKKNSDLAFKTKTEIILRDKNGMELGRITKNGEFEEFKPPKGSNVFSIKKIQNMANVGYDLSVGNPVKIKNMQTKIKEITNKIEKNQELAASDINFIDGLYYSMVAGGGVVMGNNAAKSLYHYLSADGSDLEIDPNIYLESSVTKKVIDQMTKKAIQKSESQEQGRITSQEAALNTGNYDYNYGQVRNGIITPSLNQDKDLYYTNHKFGLSSQYQKKDDGSVEITFFVKDPYDFETGPKVTIIKTGKQLVQKFIDSKYVPEFIKQKYKKTDSRSLKVPHKLSNYLTKIGKAREYNMVSQWTMKCTNNNQECTRVN